MWTEFRPRAALRRPSGLAGWLVRFPGLGWSCSTRRPAPGGGNADDADNRVRLADGPPPRVLRAQGGPDHHDPCGDPSGDRVVGPTPMP
jgi:hypothetical protein